MPLLTLGASVYQVFLAGTDLQPRQFLGTAFPIAPSGGLITCRHVTDVKKGPQEMLAVFDGELNRMVPIDDVLYPRRSGLDVAFIPNALDRPKKDFFPVLSPDLIIMGLDVYSVGFFVMGATPAPAYFKGNIVNFAQSGVYTGGKPGSTGMSLSYAVIEGLSGSPVITYHNGPKVVGLCHGSLQSRIAAAEILEYRDD